MFYIYAKQKDVTELNKWCLDIIHNVQYDLKDPINFKRNDIIIIIKRSIIVPVASYAAFALFFDKLETKNIYYFLDSTD